jgi:hypothetical protein
LRRRYQHDQARLKLLDAAKALREKGSIPPGARDAGVYRVRGASVVVPDDASWIVGVKEAITVPPKSLDWLALAARERTKELNDPGLF